jgi:hypothetical protein
MVRLDRYIGVMCLTIGPKLGCDGSSAYFVLSSYPRTMSRLVPFLSLTHSSVRAAPYGMNAAEIEPSDAFNGIGVKGVRSELVQLGLAATRDNKSKGASFSILRSI